jgi:uncharacterized protein YidB (DUF937 family)
MGGIDDLLAGLMGGKGGGAVAALAPVLGALLAGGGLGKVLAGFQEQGLSEKTDSWIGTGPNEPIDAGEVRAALGDAQLADIAQKLGITEEQAAQALAETLPQVIDQVSPEGRLRPESELDRIFGSAREPAAAT